MINTLPVFLEISRIFLSLYQVKFGSGAGSGEINIWSSPLVLTQPIFISWLLDKMVSQNLMRSEQHLMINKNIDFLASEIQLHTSKSFKLKIHPLFNVWQIFWFKAFLFLPFSFFLVVSSTVYGQCVLVEQSTYQVTTTFLSSRYEENGNKQKP